MPPPLDTLGKISAAQLAFYVPIAAFSLAYLIRYGLRRDAGWLFLSLFSLVRITGGALDLAARLSPQNTKRTNDLFVVAQIFHPIGLCILFLSTLGFTGLAGYRSYSDNPRLMHTLRGLGLVILLPFIFSLVGGILGSHIDPGPRVPAMTLRHIAAGFFGLIWLLILLVLLGCWSYRHAMRSFRRKLLLGVTLAHPILGLRTAYAILAAWSSSDLLGADPSPNPILAKFNPVTGQWIFYLTFGLLTEYVVAVIYLLSATVFSRKRHH